MRNGLFMTLIVLAVGYIIGAKWPGLYKTTMSKLAAGG